MKKTLYIFITFLSTHLFFGQYNPTNQIQSQATRNHEDHQEKTYGQFSTSIADKKNLSPSKNQTGLVRISKLEDHYEVIIFDAAFENWFKHPRTLPKGHYSEAFLEAKNRQWVSSWNARYRSGKRIHEDVINYDPIINYDYDIDYMLYHYLLYWQEVNKISLN